MGITKVPVTPVTRPFTAPMTGVSAGSARAGTGKRIARSPSVA